MRVVSSRQLIKLGLQLIARAETGTFAREVYRAALYRDGVIILLLSCRPIRRGNLTSMRLERHLTKVGDRYALSFEAHETKEGRQYDADVDFALTPFLDRYLMHYRPILLGRCGGDHVWVTWLGKRLAADSLYANIRDHTKAAFGRAINPHLFRDCAVTTVAREMPDQFLIGMTVLHHTDMRVTLAAYDQSQDSAAIDQYQGMIKSRRQAAVGAAKSRRRSARRTARVEHRAS